MKTNLIKSVISTGDLRRNIEQFELLTKQRAILLMNDETRKVLEDKCMLSNGFTPLEGLATLKAYNSRKIFIDNDLGYGEVDIR